MRKKSHETTTMGPREASRSGINAEVPPPPPPQRRKSRGKSKPLSLERFSTGQLAEASPELRREALITTKEVATLLVLCSQSLFRFADLGDDGLCRGGPDKGCGVIVSAIDVVVDRLD